MNPSTRERLGLKPPTAPNNRDRAERALATRSLMYIFVVGALIAGAALISPVSHAANEARVAITAASAAVMAVVLFVGYDRLPRWTLSVLLLCGSMLIEWAVYGSGDPTSPFLLFYIWVAFYAFYFMTRRQAAMQALFIGVAYAAVVLHRSGPLKAEVVR